MAINNNMNDAVTVIKMSARSSKSNGYASILIFINKSMCELFDLKTHVSNNYKFSDSTVVTKNWNAIEKVIDSEKTVDSNELSFTLENKIKDILNKQNVELLLLFANNNSIRSVVGLFDKIINELFEDTKTVYSVNFEFSSVEGIENPRGNKETINHEANIEILDKDSNNTSSPDDSQNLVEVAGGDYSLVKSTLLLSPVKGIPIGQVKIGDKIFVKIANESAAESKVIRELKPSELEDYQFIVPAEIVNVTIIKTGGMSLVLKLIDGVYSKIEETQPLKISIADDKRFKSLGDFPSILIKIIILGCFWVVLLIILAIYFYR